MKLKFAVAVIGVCLTLSGLTGCTAIGARAVVRAPAPAAAPHPAPTGPATAADEADEAGRTYLRLSAASNAARMAWLRAPVLTAANLAAHKQLAAHAADVTVAFSQGLRGRSWPSQAQAAVEVLDAHLQRRAAAYRRVAAAGTVAEYEAASERVPLSSPAAAQVREALGLPESGTFCACISPAPSPAGDATG